MDVRCYTVGVNHFDKNLVWIKKFGKVHKHSFGKALDPSGSEEKYWNEGKRRTEDFLLVRPPQSTSREP